MPKQKRKMNKRAKRDQRALEIATRPETPARVVNKPEPTKLERVSFLREAVRQAHAARRSRGRTYGISQRQWKGLAREAGMEVHRVVQICSKALRLAKAELR